LSMQFCAMGIQYIILSVLGSPRHVVEVRGKVTPL
jgi:hypothetical protein